MFGRQVALPAMVIALLIGVVLHPLSRKAAFTPGMVFSVKKLLRWAIALLGLRIALSDIIALGLGTAVMIIVSMTATVIAGIFLARRLGRDDAFGALAGAATAVCGASAALATSSVLPAHERRESDTVFVVIIVNLLATVLMVALPPLCSALGFDDRMTGIFLGASIHDVAQVVGAGYSVSDTAGNAATIVKLFRVFLLLPVVVSVGWWFSAHGEQAGKARVPLPTFALVFLALAIINSTGILGPAIKAPLIEASRWGLLIAIAALGLGTSPGAMMRVGGGPIAIVCGVSLVMLALPLLWLLVLG